MATLPPAVIKTPRSSTPGSWIRYLQTSPRLLPRFLSPGCKAGNPNNFGTVIVQDFFGGTFSLYGTSNDLLLSGNLQDSTLTGVLGSTGTGSIFTTKVGTFTSGSLLQYVLPNSLNVSIALTNVNNGSGFVLTGSPFTLQAFTTDASVNISADKGFVPEPASIAIALLGAVGFSFIRRRRA